MSAAAAAAPVTALSAPYWVLTKKNTGGLRYRFTPLAWDWVNPGLSAGASQLAQFCMALADPKEGYVCAENLPSHQDALFKAYVKAGYDTSKKSFQAYLLELTERGILEVKGEGEKKKIYRVVFEQFESIALKIREARRERARVHRPRQSKSAKTAQVVSIASGCTPRLRPPLSSPAEPEDEAPATLDPLSVAPGESATIELPEECDSLRCENNTAFPLQVSVGVDGSSLTVSIRRTEGEQTDGGEKAKDSAKQGKNGIYGVKLTSKSDATTECETKANTTPRRSPAHPSDLTDRERKLWNMLRGWAREVRMTSPDLEMVVSVDGILGDLATAAELRMKFEERRSVFENPKRSWGVVKDLAQDVATTKRADAADPIPSAPTCVAEEPAVSLAAAADYDAYLEQEARSRWRELPECEHDRWYAEGRESYRQLRLQPTPEQVEQSAITLFTRQLLADGVLLTLEQFAKGGLARHA